MHDRFYTPPFVAQRLLEGIADSFYGHVGDFAAGAGSLLEAAAARWPRANVFATDHDSAAIRRLRRIHPAWSVGRCDFLSRRSRSASPILDRVAGRVDLLLMNPPFSYRGGERYSVSIGGEELSCSRAAAFLATGIGYLRNGGRLVAVVPASSPWSDRDSRFYRHLALNGDFKVRETLGRDVFTEAASRTSIIEFRRDQPVERLIAVRRRDPPAVTIDCRLVRGVTNNPSRSTPTKHGRSRFVHTTEMRQHLARVRLELTSGIGRRVVGPAVLLPRVGNPSVGKICIYNARVSAKLSDCVFGLAFQSLSDAALAHRRILRAPALFRRLYSGTCAPYTTVLRVQQYLAALGILATIS